MGRERAGSGVSVKAGGRCVADGTTCATPSDAMRLMNATDRIYCMYFIRTSPHAHLLFQFIYPMIMSCGLEEVPFLSLIHI